MPEILDTARSNRRFLVRAVGFLRDAGIGQFLDIDNGLPSSPNVHEIAQAGGTGARGVCGPSGHLPSGTTVEEARDILWTFTSPELWDLLVIQREWTPARYGHWLAGMLTAALLTLAAATKMAPNAT